MAASSGLLELVVQSSVRLHPPHSSSSPKTVALSIVDSKVTFYSPAGLVLFYDAAAASSFAATPEVLRDSLLHVLSIHPHLTGQLEWTAYDPALGHSHRYQRLQITYHTDRSPGVDFVNARSPRSLSELVPSAVERHELHKEWSASALSLPDLFPKGAIALQDMKTFIGLPAAGGQVTYFADGGVAIAFKVAHPLADAQTLRDFMGQWAAACRSLVRGESPPRSLSTCFEPALLDRHAAGDVDAPSPDHSLQEIARSLPINRYDQWASKSTAPYNSAVQDPPPGDLEPKLPPLSPGTLIPWSEWDLTKPCAHRLIHFSAFELEGMYRAASTDPSIHISKHDALIAHLWSCVAKARGLENDDQDTYVDMSLGLRQRVDPPLPANFSGSPIVSAAARLPGKVVCGDEASFKVAAHVKETRDKVNKRTVPALLHEFAYEACPTRLWQCFLGLRHILLTSWVHTNLYGLQFSEGSVPVLAKPLMGSVDGIAVLLEAGPMGEHDKWHSKGVDIELYLEQEAMEELLKGRWLRMYDQRP